MTYKLMQSMHNLSIVISDSDERTAFLMDCDYAVAGIIETQLPYHVLTEGLRMTDKSIIDMLNGVISRSRDILNEVG